MRVGVYLPHVEDALREARQQGMRAERALTVSGRESTASRRWLLIEGKKCQVVATRIQTIRNPQGRPYPALRLTVPRTEWADFLVYMVANAGPDDGSRFYIVPRRRVKKDSFRRLNSRWLKPYENAWRLLRDRRMKPGLHRFEALPPVTRLVLREAGYAGLASRLIRQKSQKKWPPHWKKCLLLEGRRCQVMTASRLAASPSSRSWRLVFVRAPRGKWQPEFIIYVLRRPGSRGQPRFYVMPRERVPADTTTTLTGWLADYEDAWSMIKAAKRSLAASGARTHSSPGL